MRAALVVSTVLAVAACRPAPPEVVVVALPAVPSSLQPHVSNEEFTGTVLRNVYDTLVDLDPRLAPRPALAESWYTEDETTWVFRLRKGVRFHDGRPLHAAEVVSSVERCRTAPESKRAGGLASVLSVEARDEHTVVVRTHYATASLPNRLSNVPVWVDGAGGPLGTGAYRVTAAEPGRRITLEAFADHWSGRPEVRRLRFEAVPVAEARVAALLRGDVHLTPDVPVESLPALGQSPAVRVVAEKGLRVVFLGMDCRAAARSDVSAAPNPFHDVRVRRAVALAIDREALVSVALGGHAEVADQIVAPSVFGYAPDVGPWAPDLARARALMAEAGHPEGFETALDFMPGKYRAVEAVVQHLTKDLARIGVRVRPRPLSTGDFFARVERQDTPLYLLGWMSTSGDAGLTLDYLLHTPGAGHGIDNGAAYANPELDTRVDRAERTLGLPARQRLLHEAARIVAEDRPVVPLYRPTDLYAAAAPLQFELRADRRLEAARFRWGAAR